MDLFLKGILQGSIPVVVIVGGTNLLVKKFREPKPVLYWGSLAVATGLAFAVVQGRIPAPFMDAETFGADNFGDMEYIILSMLTDEQLEEEYGDYMREYGIGRKDLPQRLEDDYRTDAEAEYLREKYLGEDGQECESCGNTEAKGKTDEHGYFCNPCREEYPEDFQAENKTYNPYEYAKKKRKERKERTDLIRCQGFSTNCLLKIPFNESIMMGGDPNNNWCKVCVKEDNYKMRPHLKNKDAETFDSDNKLHAWATTMLRDVKLLIEDLENGAVYDLDDCRERLEKIRDDTSHLDAETFEASGHDRKGLDTLYEYVEFLEEKCGNHYDEFVDLGLDPYRTNDAETFEARTYRKSQDYSNRFVERPDGKHNPGNLRGYDRSPRGTPDSKLDIHSRDRANTRVKANIQGKEDLRDSKRNAETFGSEKIHGDERLDRWVENNYGDDYDWTLLNEYGEYDEWDDAYDILEDFIVLDDDGNEHKGIAIIHRDD